MPRVTQVIGHFTGIPDIDMSRGTAVHLACEYWDRGTLDEDSVVDEVQPYLGSYKKFEIDSGVEWDLIEHEVEHPIYGYKGRLDRTGKLFGLRNIIDIKSNAVTPGCDLQLAAYEACLPGSYVRRSLVLTPTGYHLSEPYTDPNDIKIFLSMLAVYNWKRLHLGR